MIYLLLFVFISCTPEPPIYTIEDTTPTIESEVVEDVEITLQGVYKRSIGSQYEVYDFSEQLTISVESSDKVEIIFVSPYTFDDINIIIDGSMYPYELSVDKIVICGYTYYRF